MLRFLCCLALLVPAAPAFAEGTITRLITPADTKRLEDYDTIRKGALEEARERGAPADLAVLNEVIAGSPLSFSDMDLTGSWQCRTIKVGKNLPLVVYDWFKCQVTDDGSGWQLIKLTGSQRTKGRFYTESDTRLTYLGSGFIAGDTPNTYGSGPETDQVGYAIRTGTGFRIEFPSPARESNLDILELRR